MTLEEKARLWWREESGGEEELAELLRQVRASALEECLVMVEGWEDYSQHGADAYTGLKDVARDIRQKLGSDGGMQ